MTVTLRELIENGLDARFYKIAGPGVIDTDGTWQIKSQDLNDYLGEADWGTACVKVYVPGMPIRNLYFYFTKTEQAKTPLNVSITEYIPASSGQIIWNGPDTIYIERLPTVLNIEQFLVFTDRSVQPFYEFTPLVQGLEFAGTNMIITSAENLHIGFIVKEVGTEAELTVWLDCKYKVDPSELVIPQHLVMTVYTTRNSHLFMNLSWFFDPTFEIKSSKSFAVVTDNKYLTAVFNKEGVYDARLTQLDKILDINFVVVL